MARISERRGCPATRAARGNRPLPAGDKAYSAIDGKQLWQYVNEQAAIADRYRDSGHPQFWGRIAGTSGDVEDAQWLQNKYRQLGLTDTRIQTINYFAPQWSAQSWDVTLTGAGKTTPLASAQPSYASPAPAGKDWISNCICGAGQRSGFRGTRRARQSILFVKAQPSYQAGSGGNPQARRGSWRRCDLFHRHARRELQCSVLPGVHECSDLRSGDQGR